MLLEAKPLNVDYQTLTFFANELAKQTKIKEYFHVESILKGMGGNIKHVSIEEWENPEIHYVEILGEKNFFIKTCDKLGEDMNRFILLQGLAHYILHSMRGAKPCYIKSMTIGDVAREGLIFTLALLIPDNLMIKILNNHFKIEEISHFFRLPENMIHIKLNLLKKYHIGESNNGN